MIPQKAEIAQYFQYLVCRAPSAVAGLPNVAMLSAF